MISRLLKNCPVDVYEQAVGKFWYKGNENLIELAKNMNLDYKILIEKYKDLYLKCIRAYEVLQKGRMPSRGAAADYANLNKGHLDVFIMFFGLPPDRNIRGTNLIKELKKKIYFSPIDFKRFSKRFVL